MKRVGVIVAGVQKAGTTALFEYLCAHPLLAGSKKKETHFFDNERTIDWSKPDYSFYHSFFDAADPSVQWLEATPIYVFWPDCLERIQRYNPQIKLILLFRDPIERAWSQWAMNYSRNWETLNFPSAIREGRARLGSSHKDESWRLYSYVERGMYFRQLQKAINVFTEQQIAVISMNDLRNKCEKTLRRITDFIGIPPFKHPDRLNARGLLSPYGFHISDEDREYLAAIFREDLKAFQQKTGLRVAKWLDEF